VLWIAEAMISGIAADMATSFTAKPLADGHRRAARIDGAHPAVTMDSLMSSRPAVPDRVPVLYVDDIQDRQRPRHRLTLVVERKG
jgi:hypothetical protein